MRPKPMVEVGGAPILWHIMKILHARGISEFIICLGYKGYVIKEYFANYALHSSDVTFEFATNSVKVHRNEVEPWTVTLVDTGDSSQTAGRLLRVAEYLGNEPFVFTYGDGVADIDIDACFEVHRSTRAMVTVTAVQPPGRYGSLEIAGNSVVSFLEKPEGDGAWINGGFFVVEPSALEHIANATSSWEVDVLPRIAELGRLAAYKHPGFWMAMDTLRDKTRLDELWRGGGAPWKIWE